MMARLWLAAFALAAGSAWGFGSPVGPATGVIAGLGAMVLARRRARAAGLGLAAVAFALGWCNAAIRSVPAPVETLAGDVARCVVSGEILESAGGLGTLLAVDVLECDGHRPVFDAGVVVAEVPEAEAGS